MHLYSLFAALCIFTETALLQWSREIAADVITVERNSAAKSIRKIIIYTVNRRLIYFFPQCTLKGQLQKQSTSLLVSLNIESSTIVEISRIPASGFAYIFVFSFFSVFSEVTGYNIDMRKTLRGKKGHVTIRKVSCYHSLI